MTKPAENATVEFRELTTVRNKPTHALLITLLQAYPWLKALQDDPKIGKKLGSFLDKSRHLGKNPFCSEDIAPPRPVHSDAGGRAGDPIVWAR